MSGKIDLDNPSVSFAISIILVAFGIGIIARSSYDIATKSYQACVEQNITPEPPQK